MFKVINLFGERPTRHGDDKPQLLAGNHTGIGPK